MMTRRINTTAILNLFSRKDSQKKFILVTATTLSIETEIRTSPGGPYEPDVCARVRDLAKASPVTGCMWVGCAYIWLIASVSTRYTDTFPSEAPIPRKLPDLLMHILVHGPFEASVTFSGTTLSPSSPDVNWMRKRIRCDGPFLLHCNTKMYFPHGENRAERHSTLFPVVTEAEADGKASIHEK